MNKKVSTKEPMKNKTKDKNTMNKSVINYFNVDQIKKLYSHDDNIFEQMFDSNKEEHSKRQTKKRKEKNAIINSYEKEGTGTTRNKNEKNQHRFAFLKNNSFSLESKKEIIDVSPIKKKRRQSCEKRRSSLKSCNSEEAMIFHLGCTENETPTKYNYTSSETPVIHRNKIKKSTSVRKEKQLSNTPLKSKYDILKYLCSPRKKNNLMNRSKSSPSSIAFLKDPKQNLMDSNNSLVFNWNQCEKKKQHKYIIINDSDEENKVNDNIMKNHEKKIEQEKQEQKNKLEFQNGNKSSYVAYLKKLSNNFFINNKKIFLEELSREGLGTFPNCNNSDNRKSINVNEKSGPSQPEKIGISQEERNSNSSLHNERTVVTSGSMKNQRVEDNYANQFQSNKINHELKTEETPRGVFNKSLYSYLNVPFYCSQEHIKKAFKEKIKLIHPDKGGDITEFLQIKMSYDILSNDKKRKIYNKYGNAILDILTSQEYNEYDWSLYEKMDEQEEENMLEETDNSKDLEKECQKIYDLFVLKYNNSSYLNSLNELKITALQYNEFQNVVSHFFNINRPIFKNVFSIYPTFSPYIKSWTKVKKKKKGEDRHGYKNISSIDSENEDEQRDMFITQLFDFMSDSSFDSSADCSPFFYNRSEHRTNNSSTSNNQNFAKMFHHMEKEFTDFYDQLLKEKQTDEHLSDISSYSEKEKITPSKKKIRYTKRKDTKRGRISYEQNNTEEFNEMEVSPMKNRILQDDNRSRLDEFYKWFDTFVDAENKKQEQDTRGKEKYENCEHKKLTPVKNKGSICSSIKQSEKTGTTKNKNTSHIEQKYGFNLIRANNNKIDDVTQEYNYIYIGNNIQKKKRFILFIKEDGIKEFLKIKCLIHILKKCEQASYLKQMVSIQNEIEKNIKNIEYILLLMTNEERIPLHDFYLWDKYKYSQSFFCIPICIKKKNILMRPNFINFKWIMYTLQSLVFFNYFFNKIQKYMCVFPFFNYKYYYFKKYLQIEEEPIIEREEEGYDTYIFFHEHIIKDKVRFLKYFPYHLYISLKNEMENQMVVPYETLQYAKMAKIHLSTVFIFTPHCIF